jgi:drug/metabolite transporter (DMT)-like permease
MFRPHVVGGVAVSLLVAVGVYVDARRSGFERARSLALGTGGVAALGFLAPAVLFGSVYAHPDAAGSAPLHVTVGVAGTGVVITLAVLLTYGLASRMPAGRSE